jgi:CBS domain-containing protein
MFHLHSIDGIQYNVPLEMLKSDEEVNRLEKSYTARKIIDRNEAGGGKEDGNPEHSHAVKAYREAVKINQEREPILHAYTLMKSPVMTLRPELNIHDAWNLFQESGISHMPVLSEDEKIIGIVSDRDLMKHMIAVNNKAQNVSGMTVREIMTKKVISAGRLTDIRRIAKAMFERHIGTMPIIDDAGQLAGIITRSDILYALINYPPMSLWA